MYGNAGLVGEFLESRGNDVSELLLEFLYNEPFQDFTVSSWKRFKWENDASDLFGSLLSFLVITFLFVSFFLSVSVVSRGRRHGSNPRYVSLG